MLDPSHPAPLAAIPREPYDLVIVGSGMGGGTLAYALRTSGLRILLVERGGFIPSEPQNWSADALFVERRYRAVDPWLKADGRRFQAGMVYAVGGNTKVFGASLPRFLPSDFDAVEHPDGVSPAWPIGYRDLVPHYAQAEAILGVHGEPERGREGDWDGPLPFPPVPHEPAVERLARGLAAVGYAPSHLPLGVDLRPGGACIRCGTCDAFVCRVHAKADADVRCVRPALRAGVELLTGARARRILTAADGARATGVEVERDGVVGVVQARAVVVACGAINSAALLLRSASPQHPRGLANASDAVGRHLLLHNNTVMLALSPLRRNDAVNPKTLYVNDFYERGTDDHPFPLGHLQLIGKVREQMVRTEMRPAPRAVRRLLTDRSWDWWIFSEDLPDPENRVDLAPDGSVRIAYRPNNERTHEVLVREARRMVRRAGFPIALTRRQDIDACSHQAGTVRMAADPAHGALDLDCRSHDVPNLFVVDASFMPSLPVMNPALTIAANALRVAPAVASAATA